MLGCEDPLLPDLEDDVSMPRPGVVSEEGPFELEMEEEPSEDNWKHRSSGMLCTTCMYFVPKVKDIPRQESAVGRCRRHAPTMSGWPVMFQTDWCGDHKLDENKLEDK